jgi:hypothetical protein
MDKAAIDIGKALARLSDLTIFELRYQKVTWLMRQSEANQVCKENPC